MAATDTARMKNVLLLHTGGTLGMRGSPLHPDAYAESLEDSVPELSRIANLSVEVMFNLDSSDVGPKEWTDIATRLDAEREKFDGFVIVHGTDTMAYTASALAYALQGFGKPIVLTGAQRPLVEVRSDARRNLIDATEVATMGIPESGICFDGLFMRGVRCTKSSAHDYRAFLSYAHLPLVRLGVTAQQQLPPIEPTEYSFKPAFERDVIAIPITPGFDPAWIGRLSSMVKGIVLIAYGVGTVPEQDRRTSEAVRMAVEGGVDVLVITQAQGAISFEMYPNSRSLGEAGAISGTRLCLEAATTKLMHAIANYDDVEERHQFLTRDIVGDTTS